MDRMERIEDMKILKNLKKQFEVDCVKYDVLSKSFRYQFPDEKERNITLDALIKLMADEKGETYHNLMILKREYFPRRLKEIIVAFYDLHNLELPRELYITEDGFELLIDDDTYYVEYKDDFDEFLSKFADLFGVEHKEITIIPKAKDYEGHYHD